MAIDSNNPFADLPEGKQNPFADLPDAVEAESGIVPALGAGIDKLQELGYRAVKGFTDIGANPNDPGDNTALGRTIGQGGSLSKWADEGIKRNIDEQRAYQPTVGSYKDVDSLSDAASYVGEMTAQSIPMMAATFNPVTALLMGGGLSNEAYESQEQKQPVRALASGFGQMALERLGAETAIGRLIPGNGSNIVSKVGQSALGEGLTETGQEVLSQWGGGRSLDQIENLDEAFVGGMSAGGTIRAATETGKSAYNRYKGDAPGESIDSGNEVDLTIDPELDPFAHITPEGDFRANTDEISVIPGESAQDWQPDWQFGQNDMPYRGEMQPYTYEGEFEQYHEAPNSVPLGNVLNAPVINGEFNRPRALPDRSGTIIGEDGRPEQQQQAWQNQMQNEANAFADIPSLPDKDIIFAGDNRNVQLKVDGTPFGRHKAAEISTAFRDARAQGLNPRVVRVNGGYGWVIDGGQQLSAQENINQPGYIGEENAGNIDNFGSQEVIETGDKTEGDNDGGITGDKRLAERYQELEAGTGGAIPSDPSPNNGQVEYLDGGLKPNDSALSEIDIAAHEAATSPHNDLPEPTQAQKEAGNYKKGKVKLHGFDISIENPKGSTRTGTDPDGNEWSSTMQHHYGDIKGTIGADGDSIDVFIGDNPESQKVFVVDQVDPDTGSFDEVKVMMGFDSIEAARKGYLSNYDKDWKGLGEITETTVDEFKAWTKRPRKSKQPFALPTKEKHDSGPKEQVINPIDDFGEKLLGARKHVWAGFSDTVKEKMDVSTVPLSKSFPDPDYVKMARDGADKKALALIAMLKDSIPNKPRTKYKIPRWTDAVNKARKIASQLSEGTLSLDDAKRQVRIMGGHFNGISETVDAYEGIKPEAIKQASKRWRIDSGSFSMFRGEKYDNPKVKYFIRRDGKELYDLSFDTESKAIEFLKTQLAKENGQPEKRKTKISVYQDRYDKTYFLGWKGANGVLRIAEYDNIVEARAALRDNRDEIELKLAKMKETPDMRRPENRKRVGPARFEGNVTPELFAEEFGFRGVQFGNYVENKRRQQDLNQAYDGLIDLAEVLGIPPRALSLNGKLGIAFGARGRGGNGMVPAAHYEPGSMVINLTKKSGSGSLAHEWFHALDNYFATGATGKESYMTQENRYRRIEGIRPEMREAFINVMNAIEDTALPSRSGELDKRHSKRYWDTKVEMSARSFERYVIDRLDDSKQSNDYLANIVSEQGWNATDEGTYPYPTESEAKTINKAFDRFFRTIKSKNTDDGNVALFALNSDSIGTGANNVAVSSASAKKVVSRFVAGLSDSAADNVVITSTYDDLPQSIKDAAKAQGAEYQVKGVFHKGKTYVVLDQHSSEVDMETTLFHEVYGHQGISQLFGKDITKKLNALFILNGGLKGVRDTAKRHNINLDKYIQGIEGASLPQDVKHRILMDELLAHMQQSNKPSVKRLVREIVGMIRAILRKLGLPGLSKVSDSDLFHVLRQARAATKNDPKSSKDKGAMFNLKGKSKEDLEKAGFDTSKVYYHGTFEDPFKNFDLDKFGENKYSFGEPAIYHTLSKPHAETYGNELIESYIKTSNYMRVSVADLERDMYENYGEGESIEEYFDKRRRKEDLYSILDFDQWAGNEVGYAKSQGSEGLIVDFSDSLLAPHIGEIVLSLDSNNIVNINDSLYDKDAGETVSADTPLFNRTMSNAKEKLGLGEEEALSIVDRVKKSWEDFSWKGFKERSKEGLFDSLYGIKKAEDAMGVTMEESGYISARLAQGVGDVIHAVMFHGAPQWRNGIVQMKPDTKGLLEVFSQLDTNELNDWLAWMGGNRAEKLMAEGRENNLTANEIAELKGLNVGREALFKRVKDEYNAINTATLDMAIEAGLLSRDTVNKFDSEWYVPFFRAEDTSNIDEVVHGPRTTKGVANASAQIKSLKGGSQSTKDILQNILQRQATMIDAAMKNKAMVEVAGNLAGTPYMQPVNLNKMEIEAVIKKRLAKKATPYVSVAMGGEAKWFEVQEPSLLRALTQLSVKRTDNPLMKMSRAAKRFLTTGVTLSPEFIIRNFLRDGVHGWMINKDKFTFGLDSAKGVIKTWKKDQATVDLMFAGASFQGGYVHAGDPEQGAQQIRRALRKKGMNEGDISKYMASIPKGVGELFEKYRSWSDSMENANRVATYDSSLKAGKSKKQAAFEAKDFMDFGLQGNFAAMQFFVDVIPFLNARMQGLYKLYRAGKAGEGDSFAKVVSKELAMKGMYVAGFSLALALVNMDDERYDELPDWDKDANWHFFFGDTHVRIPKPFELGVIFGTLPERLFMRASGKQNNADLGRSMGHAVVSTMAMNPMPQIIKPGFEAWANYDFFSGRPIESFSDKYKRPEDRYSMYTSETAKQLAKMLGISPKKIEHIVRGYAGTLGSYTLGAADLIGNSVATLTGNGDFKINEFDDISLVRAFVKNGEVGGTYYGEQFYDTLQEINGLYKQYQNAVQERDSEAAKDIIAKNKDKIRFRSMFNKAQAQLNELNHKRNVIWKNEGIPLAERERKIDKINLQKNAIYRRIILQYRKFNV
jgi:hypothetical protein